MTALEDDDRRNRRSLVERRLRVHPQLPARLVLAAQALGWAGVVRWPVLHNGDALAVVHSPDADPATGPGGRWLHGCLLVGRGQQAVKHASLLAGYSRRAVLLTSDRQLLAAAVDAAILDVGLVVASGAGVDLILQAGPVVESALTRQRAVDDRWQQLVTEALSAPVLAVIDRPRTGTS